MILLKEIENIIDEITDEHIEITSSTKISEIGIDSMAYLMAFEKIEQLTGVHIPDEDIAGFGTIGDILEYIDLPWNKVISFHTIRELLEKQAHFIGNTVGLLDRENDVSFTYSEIYQKVLALGTFLYYKNIREKHIILVGANSWQWVISFLALICGKNTVVPVENNISADDLKELAEHSDTTVIIYGDDMYDTVIKVGRVEKIISFSEIQKCIAEGEQLIKSGYHDYCDEELMPEDIILMPYTSGSTGSRKGVMIPQKSLVWNAYHANRNINLNFRVMMVAPFHHILGITAGILCILTAGGTILINRSIRNVISDMEYYHAEGIITVPAIVREIAKSIDNLNIDAVKELLGGHLSFIVSGGAPLDFNVRLVIDNAGIEIIPGYGMTETCPVISVSRKPRIKYASVGRLLDGIQVKIENPDERGVGELLVKDDWIMKGYYKDPELTEKSIVNGWFHTGDLGYIDDDKYLFLTGRSKNLIILSNGENVSPEQLEGLIMKNDAVQECLVYDCNDKITAEIYPDNDYCKINGIDSVGKEKYFNEIILRINDTLPQYKWIQKVILSDVPLKKSSSGKIVRKI